MLTRDRNHGVRLHLARTLALVTKGVSSPIAAAIFHFVSPRFLTVLQIFNPDDAEDESLHGLDILDPTAPLPPPSPSREVQEEFQSEHPYPCKHCNARFSTDSACNRHVVLYHAGFWERGHHVESALVTYAALAAVYPPVEKRVLFLLFREGKMTSTRRPLVARLCAWIASARRLAPTDFFRACLPAVMQAWVQEGTGDLNEQVPLR